jgi:Mesyanzhinovviridae DNA helicase
MSVAEYQYKSPPRKHQKEMLEATAHLPFFAIFWEMRVGKSHLIINNIAYLFEQNEIDGALIIAPNGVDLNWALDEIPKHLPERIVSKTRLLRYSTKKSKTKSQQTEVKWHREHTGLAILVMSYDAMLTDNGKEAALLFLEQRKAFYVLDESVSIKTPGAKRTMRIVRTAHRAKYRRILDGYPAPSGAFDMYSQFQFLDSNFWKRHKWDSATMFRHHFGVFEARHNYTHGNDYEQLLGYQNLEELNKIIAPHSSRLLQRDVLDVPPKNYEFRYFELTPKQREIYDQLEEEYKVWIDTGELVTANLAMVRELRLQQISCGYLPVGEGEPVHRIEGKNPRLELMEELLENQTEKCIIWARYKLDIQCITYMLSSKKSTTFVTYTGDTDDDERTQARNDFQKGDAQYFVSTPSSGGVGLTLDQAKNIYYYSNSYNLRHRRQSEERATADGQKHTTNIYDLVGLNTRDKKIIQNLTDKMNTSDAILGDKPGQDIRQALKEWVE